MSTSRIGADGGVVRMIRAFVVGSPFASAFAILVLCGCPAAPNVPVYVDSGDAAALLDVGPNPDRCALACANLAALHCQDARSSCVTVCEASYARHTIDDLKLTCVASATTQDAARACGECR